ncbi:hypothetical protein [Rhodoferax sediminis]|jgi:hypothetical protein|uniref:DUF4124 domain-containing protein n=1 Tax=Rhodoferax sediminis TaxID=2509614 RepID=A0A515DB71_9BURK|nr:hypothetical protein [Rhodoferax sediminis]QDL37664.1 hypothetical protein EUB48_10570 [Rhodoferax sediminis]
MLLFAVLLLSAAAQADTIYLCKAYNDSTFWAKAHCNQHQAFVERIVSVPDGMSFEQQVNLAKGEVNAASAAAAQRQAQAQQVERNTRCLQLHAERAEIWSRYENRKLQPIEIINTDQMRWKGIHAEQQRLGCSMQ